MKNILFILPELNKMNTEYINPDQEVPSVYKRGAHDGLFMGVLLSVAFLADVATLYIPAVAMLSLALKIMVPVMAYVWLRRDYRRYPTMRFFSALWMHGIAFFFFGSLICAAVMYFYMQFVNPTFIISTVRQSIEIYNGLDVPSAKQFADSMQALIDQHLLPSPITLAVTQIWATTFLGSMLTLVLTFLVKLFNKNKK